MNLTEEQKKKCLFFFNLLDANKNGRLELKDFVIFSEKVYMLYVINNKEINIRELRKRSETIFRKIQEMGNIDSKKSISMQDWLNIFYSVFFDGNDVSLSRRLTYSIFDNLFHICDQNKDGYLSKFELSEFYDIIGISEVNAMIAFDYLDENGDKRISRYEFLQGIRKFFTDDEMENTVFGKIEFKIPDEYLTETEA